MKTKIFFLIFNFVVWWDISIYAIQQNPIYIVTAASSDFYDRLLNFIGSVHRVNFEELGEIAVYDLGLTAEQKLKLSSIKKLAVYNVEMTNAELLKRFPTPLAAARGWAAQVLGWYAWKPVVIKQALEKFPYVLWMDAGTTVLKSLTPLSQYIQEKGYFVCTIGYGMTSSGGYNYDVGWGTTKYVANLFNLYAPDRQWILRSETVMGGLIGVARGYEQLFIMPMYEMTKDLRYYNDDGTAGGGWGAARNDQTLLSILSYSQRLTIFKQDSMQQRSMTLQLQNEQAELYVTWQKQYVSNKTVIYNSRSDLSKYQYFTNFIQYNK